MANEQITFDKLPQAVGYLTEQMEQIRQMVAKHCNHKLLQTNIVLLKLMKPVKSHERQSLPFTRLRAKD